MKNERGISLLEIVVAVAIMATVLLFLSRGFITSMFMTRQSDEYAAAARAAREKMEEIVSLTFRHYDRKSTGAGKATLEIDPKTGQYKTKIASAEFAIQNQNLATILQVESVDGPRGATTADSYNTVFSSPKMSGYDTDPFGRLHPFKVYLTDVNPDDPNSTRGLLPGLADDYAGEVILITGETNEDFLGGGTSQVPINPANKDQVHGVGSWGGDLLPVDTKPDGFLSFTLPVDLNGDGLFDLNTKNLKNNQVRLPVGVIVRWHGRYGPERYETWTILSLY